MTRKKTQQINIEKEQPKEIIKEDPKIVIWSYTLPSRSTSFYLLISLCGILLVWLSLNYIHSYVLAIIVIFGLIIIIGKSMSKQELNFFFTDEYVALDNQQIEWEKIKHAAFLPYNQDYLISLHPQSFPYVNVYIPVPKERIQEISELVSKHTEIKDFKTQTLIDRLVRFLIF